MATWFGPKPEWTDDANNVPSGRIVQIEPWGEDGAIFVEGEKRAFAAYVFELESEREGLRMARHLQLDAQDRRALHKLDDEFTISADGEVAVVSGEMELTVKRPDHDGGNQFLLTLTFPGGEDLEVRIRRVQLLEQLDIGGDADAP